MYLRTTRRKNLDGSVVEYFQLAHNHRDPDSGTVQAQVIHNFGRRDQLDRDELVRLCRSIARVCDLEVSDPLTEGVASERGGVLPQGVEQLQTRALGAVLVVEALWERCGLGETVRKLARDAGRTVPYERALLAMTANRLCEPHSKLGVWDKWLKSVYLPSCRELKLGHMYEAMDLLHQHAAKVEETVFFQTADLLNLQVDVVFYDTTTCSFCIDEPDDEQEGGLRCFGHNSEGTWRPQVVVALAVTRQGLPVRSWVFAGNKADATTVEQVKRDLRGWKLGRALFVADGGMNSESNRTELVRAVGHYLLAMRVGSVKEVKQEVLRRPGRYRLISDNLQAKEVVVGEGELRRRYILCYNPEQAEREAAHRAQVVAELEHELAGHPDLSASAKWAVELLASRRYGRYLKTDGSGRVLIDRAAIREAARLDGKWVLLTNDETLSVEDAATGYKSLLVIERCFRALKRTQIQLTPMYHWLPRRIEAHVKICVLALLIERVAELAVGQPWPRIRRTLERLQATEFATPSHRFFQSNRVPAETAAMLRKLGISAPQRVLAVAEQEPSL